MSDPLITPSDLAVYLRDSSIDVDRAAMMITDAQALCDSVVSPLPAAAAGIVRKVAGRGYVTATTSKAAAGSPMGAPGGMGGVWLSRADKADLRRLSGGSSAFSIDTLPTGVASVQTVSVVGAPTAGSFVLATAFGQTASIDIASTYATVQALLAALPNLAGVTVTGTPGAWTVRFPATLGPFPGMSVAQQSLTGGTQPQVLVTIDTIGAWPPGYGLAAWDYSTAYPYSSAYGFGAAP